MSLVLRFHNVSFEYPASPSPVVSGLSFQLHPGWMGVVGPNGAGKSTVLQLATGELEPTEGSVGIPDSVIYCQQRTDDPSSFLADFMDAVDAEAWEIRGRLGIGEDWPDRWETLSHGERKRVQIGVALWRDPALLAVDEPTNHLDLDAARLLSDGLLRHRGIGLLVSHDRDLLDRLCSRCLFLGEHSPVLRPGGYSQGVEQAELENETALQERGRARAEKRRLEQEAAKRRDLASRSHQLRSKRGIPMRDHDAKAKKNLARVSGKDGQAGRLLNQMTGRLEQARAAEEAIDVVRKRTLGIWMPADTSRRDTLLHVEPGTLSIPGTDEDPGAGWRLRYPELVMRPTDRIGITGPNGAGKSALLRHLLSGATLPAERRVYVPQEIDREDSRRVLDRVRDLNREELGRMMAVISHLGSDPRRILESALPSPGEVRKLLLAEGVARVPHLIVLDEPTNHLDLPSIESLESALADCPCGILLVSHDLRFLERLAPMRWEIAEGRDGYEVTVS